MGRLATEDYVDGVAAGLGSSDPPNHSYVNLVLAHAHLLSLWDLGPEGNPPITIPDLKGAHHGTYNPGTAPLDARRPGPSLLNGDWRKTYVRHYNQLDNIDFGDIYPFLGNAHFSVETLVRLWNGETGGNRTLGSKASGQTNTGWWFGLQGNVLRLFRNAGGYDFVETAALTGATAASGAGQKYHLVGTYDGSNLRLYVNGSLAAGPGASGRLLTPTTQHLKVGYLDGSSDGPGSEQQYFAVYDEALTAAEVTAHYNASLAAA